LAHGRIKAEERRTEEERMRAAKEARAYERHLERLNQEVFPHNKVTDSYIP
jgi:hypothetical protein